MCVVVLLSIYAGAALTAARTKSITFDELAHITAGVSYWRTGDYRLFPQNGTLAPRLAALPLLGSAFTFTTTDDPAWTSANVDRVGFQFLYGRGNDARSIVWRARLALLPVGMLLGWVIYRWARGLWGRDGGLVSLALFVLSPAMLAHGPLATSDMTAALLFTGSAASLWRVLHVPTWPRVAGSAVVVGLLCVTKMSAILMVPVAAVLVLLRMWRAGPLLWGSRRMMIRDPRRVRSIIGSILVIHLLTALLVIWASYGFRFSTFREHQPGQDGMFLGETLESLSAGQAYFVPLRIAQRWGVLPETYVFGVAHVLNRSGRFIGFVNGRYSLRGWWWFFPYTALVKTPLPFFVILGMAGAAGVWRIVSRPRDRLARVGRTLYRTAPLWVLILIYGSAAISSQLNLGERHLLPIYPAMFVLAGGAAAWLRSSARVAAFILIAAVSWAGVESARVWPDYLAYFNPIAGGPTHGYRHLVDSSLDWGQDLPGLRAWIERERRRDPARIVYLSYFGTGHPDREGIDARQLYSYIDWREPHPLVTLGAGTYCISATMLQSIYTRAPGHWAVAYEERYQQLRRAVEVPEPRAELLREFDALRFARLCAYLRQREPDDQVGHSILMYRLSDEDVRRALFDPPAELVAQVDVEGLR